ncbi:MAG: hypothetical protein QG577_1951, partial [Thermodesulfobacteriota bacterium]|nr:hypothetical protein [Thermodesulfobacteriota bacterium]
MDPKASIRKMHDLSREELSGLLGILVGNVLVHYGMWFSETVRRVGLNNAVQLEQEAFQKYGPLAMTRLEPTIGAHPSQTLTDQIAQEKQEDLREILGNLAKTWVIGDGCWFQGVEAVH